MSLVGILIAVGIVILIVITLLAWKEANGNEGVYQLSGSPLGKTAFVRAQSAALKRSTNSTDCGCGGSCNDCSYA